MVKSAHKIQAKPKEELPQRNIIKSPRSTWYIRFYLDLKCTLLENKNVIKKKDSLQHKWTTKLRRQIKRSSFNHTNPLPHIYIWTTITCPQEKQKKTLLRGLLPCSVHTGPLLLLFIFSGQLQIPTWFYRTAAPQAATCGNHINSTEKQ